MINKIINQSNDINNFDVNGLMNDLPQYSAVQQRKDREKKMIRRAKIRKIAIGWLIVDGLFWLLVLIDEFIFGGAL